MKNNKKKGFTLVELLVVIAILAILATVSVVGYTSFIERATVSNDENVAAQLNQFLVAVKADSNGPFYAELQANDGKITADNIRKITDYILVDSGYGKDNLKPQAEKYGYHFYFDLDEQQYVVIGDKDERILGMSPLGRLLAYAEDNSTSDYPESCFTRGGNYFLVETGTELANLIAGYKSITSAGDLDAYYTKVLEHKTHAKKTLPGLISWVENTVFTTEAGYLVVDDNASKVLYIPESLAGINLSGVKNNVRNDESPKAIGSSNPLINLGEKSVFTIPTPKKIYAHSLWFNEVGSHDYSHYNNADGTPKDEYKTTLKFECDLRTLVEIVDKDFTNVVFEVAGSNEQYGYINGEIVLLRDRTQKYGVTTQLGISDFFVGIKAGSEVINSEHGNIYLVALDTITSETKYTAYVDGFKSNDALNPTYVPDEIKTVAWTIDVGTTGATVDGTVISNIQSAGSIIITAQSTVTGEIVRDYTIYVGSITDAKITCLKGTTEVPLNFKKDDDNNWTTTVEHKIVDSNNNVFAFTVNPEFYYPGHIEFCDDEFVVTINDEFGTASSEQVTYESKQEDNTVSINFKKAGTYTVTISYANYSEVKKSIVVKVSNVLTSFVIGYNKYGENNPPYTAAYDSIDFDALGTHPSFDMEVYAVTSDGGNLYGHTVVWSMIAPNGSTATIDEVTGVFTPDVAGTYEITATVDGIAAETPFKLYVSQPEYYTIKVGGLNYPVTANPSGIGFTAQRLTAIKMTGNPLTLNFEVGVQYSNSVPDRGDITPENITVTTGAAYATYDGNGHLTITAAGTYVIEITNSEYPEMDTVLTIVIENKVTNYTLTPNEDSDKMATGTGTIYIAPECAIGTEFTIDANFEFEFGFVAEEVEPKVTWTVVGGETYIKCTDDGIATGKFELVQIPAAGTEITIQAKPDGVETVKTITVVFDKVTGFDLSYTNVAQNVTPGTTNTYLGSAEIEENGVKVTYPAVYVYYNHSGDPIYINPTNFQYDNYTGTNAPKSEVEYIVPEGNDAVTFDKNELVVNKNAESTEVIITVAAKSDSTVTQKFVVRIVKPTMATVIFNGKEYNIYPDGEGEIEPDIAFTTGSEADYAFSGFKYTYTYNGLLSELAAPTITPVATSGTDLFDVGENKITITKKEGVFTFTVQIPEFEPQTFKVYCREFKNLFIANNTLYNNLDHIVVGNSGAIPLSALFTRATVSPDAIDGDIEVQIEYLLNDNGHGTVLEDVTVTGYSLDANNNLSGTITIPTDKIAVGANNATIKIRLGYNKGSKYFYNEIEVKYVAGKNIDADGEWPTTGSITSNLVLLSNIDLGSTDTQITVSGDKTIYGNNYKVTTTMAGSSGGLTDQGTAKRFITLSNGKIENLIVIGPVYYEYAYSYVLSNNTLGIVSYSGTNTITDSYLFGFAAPVAVSAGNLTVTTAKDGSHSVIEGGNLANIYFYPSATGTLTLNNTYTIQNRGGYQSTNAYSWRVNEGSFLRPNYVTYSEKQTVYGMGIFLDSACKTTIYMTGDTHQFNFITLTDASAISTRVTTGQMTAKVIESLFDDTGNDLSSAVHKYSNVGYINMGIIHDCSQCESNWDGCNVQVDDSGMKDEHNEFRYYAAEDGNGKQVMVPAAIVAGYEVGEKPYIVWSYVTGTTDDTSGCGATCSGHTAQEMFPYNQASFTAGTTYYSKYDTAIKNTTN